MPNPYVLFAGLALAIGLFCGGAWTGARWSEGAHAIAINAQVEQDQKDAVELAQKARADALAESAVQLAAAQKAAAGRAANREKQHALDLEIAKDEKANHCTIAAGTFGVLTQSIETANTAAGIAPETDGGDGPLRPASETGRPDGGGPGALDRPVYQPLLGRLLEPAPTIGLDTKIPVKAWFNKSGPPAQ